MGEAGRWAYSPSGFLQLGANQGWKGGSELLLCGVLTKGRLLGFLSVKHLFGQGRKAIKGEKSCALARYFGVRIKDIGGEIRVLA